MRKPVQFVLIALVALLAVATAVLFVSYRQTSTDLTTAKNAREDAQSRYAQTIDAISQIQDSLNAISLGDTNVAARPWNQETGQKLANPSGQEALDRISLLRASISRSKDRILLLEANLKKSGIKLASLQKMIRNLKENVAQKEQAIALLSTRVDSLSTQVTSLNNTVTETQEQVRQRDQTIEEKRHEIATVLYAVGNKSELKKDGVIMSKGGVLGLGKTWTPSPLADESVFTPMDTDQQTVIYTTAPKARVLSAQPPSSYEMRIVDGKMELHITNTEQFRKIKKVVILTS
jgi:peptidoglycan hydrolase CwlO-like protein